MEEGKGGKSHTKPGPVRPAENTPLDAQLHLILILTPDLKSPRQCLNPNHETLCPSPIT